MYPNKLFLTLDTQIDNRIKKIANKLFIEASSIENLGLLNGKMGIVIFFYHYARYCGNMVFEKYADDLIDKIYEAINNYTPVNFADGLTGIGWGIEHLIQNGFLEGDRDEVLAEIDNIVFRNSLDKNYNDDLVGYGFYYMARLRGRENDFNNPGIHSKILHLICLVDDYERILFQERYLEFNIKSLNIDLFSSFVWFLREMFRFDLFKEKVEKLFIALPDQIEFYLQNSQDNVSRYQLLRLTKTILNSVSDTCFQNKLNIIIKLNNLKVPYTRTSEDIIINDFIKSTWQQMVYIPYTIDDIDLKYLKEMTFSIIGDEENRQIWLNKIDNRNIGLNGLAGLALGILSESVKS